MTTSRWGEVLRNVALMGLVALMTGCSGAMKPEDFADTKPRFVLEDYFAGKTTAWGMFIDRFGNLRRQFLVDIDGKWDGKTLVLNEQFSYADGDKDQRIWTITKVDDHTYTGTAGDVVGTAKGRSHGNALNWNYFLNLKVGGSTWKVHFDDWMFLQPQGVLLNRAAVTKWGLDVGEVQLSFRKPDQRQAKDQVQDNLPQLGRQQAAE